ncbi:MAG: acyl-CoA dehydrogenase family protein [Candidatus Methanofastidiosia archaeon]
MTFLYTQKEREFKKELSDFVKKEIAPIAERIERENSIPKEIFERLGKKGYLGVLHEKAYGGTQRGVVYETMVAEEISSVSPALDMSRLASVTLYGMPLRRFGNHEQKLNYLKPIALGEKLGAIGITEPKVGSDTAGMETRAEREGGEWILNGEKRFITNGSNASYIVVFAITNPKVHPKDGMTAFIIETQWDGFHVVKDFELLGMHGVRNTHFRLENMHVPEENVLGGVGNGFAVLMDELNSERVAIAGEACGYALGAFREAVKYSCERRQFDREIRKFEGVSFKIADMSTKIEAARLLTYQAAKMLDDGMDSTLHCSMAKYFATEIACEVCDEALQVLGGIGYTKEKIVERLYRDARLMRIGGGTSEIMKFLIQREIYKSFGFD